MLLKFLAILLLATSVAEAHPARSPAGLTLNVVALQGGAGVRQTLILNDDGRAAGSGGCNRFNASFERSGDRLRFKTPFRMTRRACGKAVMAAERRYMEALGKTRRYGLVGHRGGIALLDENGVVLVTLQPAN